MKGTAFQSVGTFDILSYQSFGLLNFVPALYNVLSIIDISSVLSYVLSNPSLSDNDADCVLARYTFFCKKILNTLYECKIKLKILQWRTCSLYTPLFGYINQRCIHCYQGDQLG